MTIKLTHYPKLMLRSFHKDQALTCVCRSAYPKLSVLMFTYNHEASEVLALGGFKQLVRLETETLSDLAKLEINDVAHRFTVLIFCLGSNESTRYIR